MSRCKRYLQSSVMHKIYNSLILSRINYGITCWGFDTKRIYKLQKKALRVICKTKYNAHTDPLFLKLNTLKAKDIFQNQCLRFFYHFEKGNSPVYFHNIVERNISGHSHNTRQINIFQSTNAHKISSEKTLRHVLPKILIAIPDNVINSVYTHSLQSVKHKFKSFKLNSYQKECTIRNCYVCKKK